jgi:hypothetical protein
LTKVPSDAATIGIETSEGLVHNVEEWDTFSEKSIKAKRKAEVFIEVQIQ